MTTIEVNFGDNKIIFDSNDIESKSEVDGVGKNVILNLKDGRKILLPISLSDLESMLAENKDKVVINIDL